MIGLDTNVLVRLLTRDDEEQAEKARALLDRHADEDGALFVSDVVLVELVWTLERSYGLAKQEIARTVMALADNATLGFESRGGGAVRTPPLRSAAPQKIPMPDRERPDVPGNRWVLLRRGRAGTIAPLFRRPGRPCVCLDSP
ncbi:MAG: PIN domain-containing protein, partial [Pseudomonadota bacterium]